MLDWYERLQSDGWQAKADKKRTTEEQKSDTLRFLNERNDYILTFGTEAGMRVLLDQMEDSCILKPFDKWNAEIYSKEGDRCRVLKIMAHVPRIAARVFTMLCDQVEKRIEAREKELKQQLDQLR